MQVKCLWKTAIVSTEKFVFVFQLFSSVLLVFVIWLNISSGIERRSIQRAFKLYNLEKITLGALNFPLIRKFQTYLGFYIYTLSIQLILFMLSIYNLV